MLAGSNLRRWRLEQPIIIVIIENVLDHLGWIKLWDSVFFLLLHWLGFSYCCWSGSSGGLDQDRAALGDRVAVAGQPGCWHNTLVTKKKALVHLLALPFGAGHMEGGAALGGHAQSAALIHREEALDLRPAVLLPAATTAAPLAQQGHVYVALQINDDILFFVNHLSSNHLVIYGLSYTRATADIAGAIQSAGGHHLGMTEEQAGEQLLVRYAGEVECVTAACIITRLCAFFHGFWALVNGPSLGLPAIATTEPGSKTGEPMSAARVVVFLRLGRNLFLVRL